MDYRISAIILVCPLFALSFVVGCRPAGEKTLEETIEHTYPVGPDTSLSITNRDGSIRVYGAGGEMREVRVEAIKKAYNPERLKAISLNATRTSGSLSIETIYPPDSGPGFADRSGTVDYVIVVPQRMRISKFYLENGEVLIEEIRGDQVREALGNGRLFAHNCFGHLDLHVKTGNLAIVYEWWEEQVFSIRSKVDDGNAFAYIPSDAAFHLIAQTATGKIENDFEEKEQRHSEPENKVDMTVGGDARTLFQFETEDGNIKISEHNP